MLEVLPWHQSQWDQVQASIENRRLAHAWLLSGPVGIGLEHFAHQLAACLLCLSGPGSQRPCGQCRSCELFAAGNHPDSMFVVPEEPGKQIKVEQIRDIIDFIYLKSQYERYKIAIISPAHSMNRSAANTLLKTLEEPPGDSLIMLITDRPNLLPVTVRSRCQQLDFQPDYSEGTLKWLASNLPEGASAENLLRFAGGAPLAALELPENHHMEQLRDLINDLLMIARQRQALVAIAEKWNEIGAGLVIRWLLRLFSDMLRMKISAPPQIFYPTDSQEVLQGLINQLNLDELIRCHDLLLHNYGLALGQVSFNTQGLLEDFIIFWQELSKNEDKT